MAESENVGHTNKNRANLAAGDINAAISEFSQLHVEITREQGVIHGLQLQAEKELENSLFVVKAKNHDIRDEKVDKIRSDAEKNLSDALYKIKSHRHKVQSKVSRLNALAKKLGSLVEQRLFST